MALRFQDFPFQHRLTQLLLIRAFSQHNHQSEAVITTVFRTNSERDSIADVAGQIAAIRFWKSSSESGTHVGHIWDSKGTLLATVTFANETASGWQQQSLGTPLTVTANTEYLVSVNTGKNYYVATNSGLAAKINNKNLHSEVGSNGRYGAVCPISH